VQAQPRCPPYKNHTGSFSFHFLRFSSLVALGHGLEWEKQGVLPCLSFAVMGDAQGQLRLVNGKLQKFLTVLCIRKKRKKKLKWLNMA
jgi:hypothetical protein